VGGTCNSHDGMCEQITKTREDVAALKVKVEPIMEMQKTLDDIRDTINRFTGVKFFILWLIPTVISLVAIWTRH
jgi:hypothetical protein